MFLKGNTVESINFGGLNARLEGFCIVNVQRNPNLVIKLVIIQH